LGVVDGLEIAAPEHRRAEPLAPLERSFADRREDRHGCAGRREGPDRVAVHELALIRARRHAIPLDQRDLLHRAWAARVVVMARRARSADIERAKAVGFAEDRIEAGIALLELLELRGRRGAERGVGGIVA